MLHICCELISSVVRTLLDIGVLISVLYFPLRMHSFDNLLIFLRKQANKYFLVISKPIWKFW